MIKSQQLFAALLLGLLSCKQPKIENYTIRHKPKPVNKDSLLVGKWMNCVELFLKSGQRPLAMSRNACTIIRFEKNHSGSVETEGENVIFPFRWIVENNNKLKINHPHNKNRIFFDGGVYKLEFKNVKQMREVALFDTIQNIKHILDR